MANDFNTVMAISASGLTAQTARMRVIAENIANAGTTPTTPNQAPYQRQIITFRNVFDRVQGANKVAVGNVVHDKSPFGKRYEPTNPSADKNGYVQISNVQTLIETMDMRQAQRSYEANLSVIEASRTMMARTLDLLK